MISYNVVRWNGTARIFSGAAVVLLVVLALGPVLFSANMTDRLTTLFVYVIIAAMWNALAGYGGLVSIGQQLFIGLGGYFLVRLSDAGVPLYGAIILAILLVGVLSFPLANFMLRLLGAEFAIGMWVLAELAHFLINLDPVVQGETGTSLVAINSFAPAAARDDTYWMALVLMSALLGMVFFLLRGRVGASIQAIRDDEIAAASVGVNVQAMKRVIFVLAAMGCAAGGALWLCTTISFQPQAFFGVQWTAYMLFMALVGGLGTFEGPLIGALLFFFMETWFGATGVVYLIGLGAAALGFALFLPQGIWGACVARFGIQLLPTGYILQTKMRGTVPSNISRSAIVPD